jgi:hypothetical protein
MLANNATLNYTSTIVPNTFSTPVSTNQSILDCNTSCAYTQCTVLKKDVKFEVVAACHRHLCNCNFDLNTPVQIQFEAEKNLSISDVTNITEVCLNNALNSTSNSTEEVSQSNDTQESNITV